jgi:hypothetical protein
VGLGLAAAQRLYLLFHTHTTKKERRCASLPCRTRWGLCPANPLPGTLLHKQGPRRARLRAAPLPHPHSALLAAGGIISYQVNALRLLRQSSR